MEAEPHFGLAPDEEVQEAQPVKRVEHATQLFESEAKTLPLFVTAGFTQVKHFVELHVAQ